MGLTNKTWVQPTKCEITREPLSTSIEMAGFYLQKIGRGPTIRSLRHRAGKPTFAFRDQQRRDTYFFPSLTRNGTNFRHFRPISRHDNFHYQSVCRRSPVCGDVLEFFFSFLFFVNEMAFKALDHDSLCSLCTLCCILSLFVCFLVSDGKSSVHISSGRNSTRRISHVSCKLRSAGLFLPELTYK